MKKTFDPTEWISQAEAARMRGLSRQAISQLVKRGRVTKLVIAGKTLVRRSDVEKFQPDKPGPKSQRRGSKQSR
jgi:predicted DNA-binding protein (UPF0251 family)